MRDASLPFLFETYLFEERGGIVTTTAVLQSHCSNLI
jgi:hypothetical protein